MLDYDWAGRQSMGAWRQTGYAYDPAGRLQTISLNPAGTSRDHDLGFTYNPASQVHSRSASNDAYAWAPPATYVRTYAANGLNQYSSTTTGGAPIAYAYDANGNLTADGSHSFVYDVENRLVSATGAHAAELAYDPLGRLFQVTSGASLRRLVYDGDALVAEYDVYGGMPHRYIHGNDPGADDPLVWYHNSVYGWRQVLLHDHQGSVIGVTDMYGNPIAANSYDPWGIPGPNNQGRFGYTGQTWLPELGMWYYKARVYSPVLGRFLQVDPVGYEDQMNLYAYVGNDPVNGTDPSGQYECKSRDACTAAAKGIPEIRAARNYYRSAAIGSLAPRHSAAAAVLGKTLSSLGRENDGGVNIEIRDLPGSQRGEFDGSNTISLDTKEISRTNARVGEILGHETQHFRQRDESLVRIRAEVRPLVVQYLIGSVPGGSIPKTPNSYYVMGRLAIHYCKGGGNYCVGAAQRAMDAELRKPY